jgi:hypothetical protein
MMCDIAVAVDPSLVPPLFSPMTAPDEMATLWRELGMVLEKSGRPACLSAWNSLP